MQGPGIEPVGDPSSPVTYHLKGLFHKVMIECETVPLDPLIIIVYVNVVELSIEI